MSVQYGQNHMDSPGKWTIGGELDITGALKHDGVSILGDRSTKVDRVALAAVDTAGGLFAWENAEGVAVLVTKVVIDLTTKATAACTADVGVAADGTTLDDTLIDGVDLNAATGVFDNIDDQGTNGKATQKVADGSFVTGSVASGASAGIVGFAYIHYHRI